MAKQRELGCHQTQDYSDEVKEGEYKHPDQVYKVPVQTNFFNHLIMAALFKRTVGGRNKAPH